MSSTETAPNVFQQIESTLSADWQKAVSFLQQAAQFFATFLGNVAAGLPVLVADVEGVAAGVAGKLSTINASLGVASDLASKVAPNDTSVQKLLSDIGQGAQDLADVHVALTTGITAGDPQVVTTAVSAINAASDLERLLNSAHAVLGSIAGASPTATQAVSPPTPQAG